MLYRAASKSGKEERVDTGSENQFNLPFGNGVQLNGLCWQNRHQKGEHLQAEDCKGLRSGFIFCD